MQCFDFDVYMDVSWVCSSTDWLEVHRSNISYRPTDLIDSKMDSIFLINVTTLAGYKSNACVIPAV